MRRLEGYFLIIIAGVLYGTIPIFATLLSSYQVSTIEQIFIRLLFSLAVFSLFVLFVRGHSLRISPRDYIQFFFFGLYGTSLFFTLYVSAAVMTSVTVTVLLLYTQPIFTLIITRLFFRRRVHAGGYIAILLALIGVCIIFRIWSVKWQDFSLGHIFALATGFLYSIYIIFMRIQTQKYSTLTVTYWAFFFGLIWLVPLWYIMRLAFHNPTISAVSLNLPGNAWLLLLGFAILPTIMAYLIFNHGMRTVEPHRAGVLVLSEPLGAIIMGALILGQRLYWTDIIGGIFILIAFLIIKRQKR
jgi:DME family drug/metabolite transporter